MSTRSIGAFKESPIVALLDARQVGKTTLAKLYGNNWVILHSDMLILSRQGLG